MKIELLNERTVKVLLSKLDMSDMRLSYEEMDSTSELTKQIVLKLLDEIKQEVKLDFSKGKIFIEAFPYADGGCVLYVNLVSREVTPQATRATKPSFKTPLVFSFGTIEALSKVAVRLQSRCSHIILKSDLYFDNQKYFLLLYTYFKMDSEITRIAIEYGKFCGKGAVASALVREHAKELTSQNAVSLLSSTLG